MPLDHITPLSIRRRWLIDPFPWDIAALSRADEGDEKRLDGEQKKKKTFTGLSSTDTVEAACRTLVHGYN